MRRRRAENGLPTLDLLERRADMLGELAELGVTLWGGDGQLKRSAFKRRQREEQQRHVGIVQRVERGFQLAHSSDPSFRIVGRNNDRLRALRVCASSTHATSKPSSDLIEFRCRVLHSLEDNQSIPRRHNAIVKDLQVSADAEALDLRLDQPFRRLRSIQRKWRGSEIDTAGG